MPTIWIMSYKVTLFNFWVGPTVVNFTELRTSSSRVPENTRLIILLVVLVLLKFDVRLSGRKSKYGLLFPFSLYWLCSSVLV